MCWSAPLVSSGTLIPLCCCFSALAVCLASTFDAGMNLHHGRLSRALIIANVTRMDLADRKGYKYHRYTNPTTSQTGRLQVRLSSSDSGSLDLDADQPNPLDICPCASKQTITSTRITNQALGRWEIRGTRVDECSQSRRSPVMVTQHDITGRGPRVPTMQASMKAPMQDQTSRDQPAQTTSERPSSNTPGYSKLGQ